MRAQQVILFFTLMLGLSACRSNGPAPTAPQPDGIILENATGETIHTLAIEQNTLSHVRLNLYHCPDLDEIAVGATRVLATEAVPGYKNGDSIILFWWTLGERSESCFRIPRQITSRLLSPSLIASDSSVVLNNLTSN